MNSNSCMKGRRMGCFQWFLAAIMIFLIWAMLGTLCCKHGVVQQSVETPVNETRYSADAGHTASALEVKTNVNYDAHIP